MLIKIILLNDWPFWNFPEWTASQTSAFWTALAAIGTVGTLIYVLIDAYKNRKKINDLAKITKELAAQNKLILDQNELQRLMMKNSVRPELTVENGVPNVVGVKLIFKNIGQKAVITEVKYIEDRVVFERLPTPYTFFPDTQFSINGSFDQYGVLDQQWTISFHFHDAYNNSYIFLVMGIGRTIQHQATTEKSLDNKKGAE